LYLSEKGLTVIPGKRYPQLPVEDAYFIHQIRVLTGLAISLPANQMEVKNWGMRQGHCIATYASRHNTNGELLIQVVDPKFPHVLYHAQIYRSSGRPTRLGQFYGKQNSHVPSELRTLMVDAFGKADKLTLPALAQTEFQNAAIQSLAIHSPEWPMKPLSLTAYKRLGFHVDFLGNYDCFGVPRKQLSPEEEEESTEAVESAEVVTTAT
jgi:hypothetical protein